MPNSSDTARTNTSEPDELIDNSSFGTPAARSLRARTSPEAASDITSRLRRASVLTDDVDLKSDIVDGQGESHGLVYTSGVALQSASAMGIHSSAVVGHAVSGVDQSDNQHSGVVAAVQAGDDPQAAHAARSRLARDRLSQELRRLRVEACMTGSAAAQATGMSQSKLSKIENGMLLPSIIDVERLVAELSATRETRLELVELARQLHAEAETRRVVLHRGAHRHQQTIARIEARATTNKFFQLAGVPSLLQTENYLQRVLAATSGREKDPALTTLRERRARLGDPNKKFIFLLSESALRWRMGAADLMCEQIDHMKMVGRSPNVELGVVPWSADANLVALHGFQIYDDRVVTVSVLTGNATITDPQDVREYSYLFGRLNRLALRGDQLDGLLSKISADHRNLG